MLIAFFFIGLFLLFGNAPIVPMVLSGCFVM